MIKLTLQRGIMRMLRIPTKMEPFVTLRTWVPSVKAKAMGYSSQIKFTHPDKMMSSRAIPGRWAASRLSLRVLMASMMYAKVPKA